MWHIIEKPYTEKCFSNQPKRGFYHEKDSFRRSGRPDAHLRSGRLRQAHRRRPQLRQGVPVRGHPAGRPERSRQG